jgi:hypothetical protein
MQSALGQHIWIREKLKNIRPMNPRISEARKNPDIANISPDIANISPDIANISPDFLKIKIFKNM